MGIYCYRDIEKFEIESCRKTKNGNDYSLDHSENLIVDMRFRGAGKSNSNAQGWERNGNYYFKQLMEAHPEYFSKNNLIRIKKGKIPIVDERFIENFPEYRLFNEEPLVHHHIGGDGQGVAVPKSIHEGYGVIHVEENKLGIRKNAEDFSSQCSDIVKNHPEMTGKTAGDFKAYIAKNNINSAIELIDPHNTGNNYEQPSYKMEKKKIKNVEASEKQLLSRRISARFAR